jgi:hypothetical protein
LNSHPPSALNTYKPYSLAGQKKKKKPGPGSHSDPIPSLLTVL